jgi:acyl-CoA synthetase (AMP-forming)/AMP-acid ligase II
MQKVFGLKFGDTIALCLPNSIEFPIVSLAANEAALIVTTVNPVYTAGKNVILIKICFIIHTLVGSSLIR